MQPVREEWAANIVIPFRRICAAYGSVSRGLVKISVQSKTFGMSSR